MTLADLNACSPDEFVRHVGWIFEHSPWVAEAASARRPFASPDAMLRTMTDVVAQAQRDRQLALLCAHPDLGARARMSEASTGEQAGAGLDRLTRDQFARLHQLNAAYRERFGFPFLYAVKGSTSDDVLTALDTRLHATPAEEFAEALRQVARIAGFRLQDVLT